MGFTLKEMQRYRVLMDVLEKKTKAKEASLILGLSYPQILRLKKRVKEKGAEGLLRIRREEKRKIPEAKCKVIAFLI